jgi:hypothetical protein
MRLKGAWRQKALDLPSGVTSGAGPVGHSDRTNAYSAEASERASMPPANVVASSEPTITEVVGVIVALLRRGAPEWAKKSEPCPVGQAVR